MWKDADPVEVKALWGEELARFDPSDILAAIELLRYAHLDYPPTLYEFGNLCRDAQRKRTQFVAALTGPRTEMPEHIKQQFAVFKAKYHA